MEATEIAPVNRGTAACAEASQSRPSADMEHGGTQWPV